MNKVFPLTKPIYNNNLRNIYFSLYNYSTLWVGNEGHGEFEILRTKVMGNFI